MIDDRHYIKVTKILTHLNLGGVITFLLMGYYMIDDKHYMKMKKILETFKRESHNGQIMNIVIF